MEKKYKRKLLLIGPLPPPIGGTRVSFNLLVKQNKEFFNSFESFDIIDLKVNGSSKLKNFILQIKIFFNIIFTINKYDIASIHVNSKRIFYWSLFIRLCKGNCKINYRFFGGDLDYYVSSNVQRRLMKFSLRNTSLFIQTKGLVNYITKINIPNCKVIWFPTSRSIPTLNFVKSSNNKPIIRFIYVGHLRKEKGTEILVDVCNKLNHNNYKFILTLIGKIFSNELKQKISKASYINYLGEIENNEIFNHLSNSDLMVYPSYWEGEGYPGTLIESKIMGLPIIVSNHRYLSELISDGNGLLVIPKSKTSLYNAMRKTLSDKRIIKNLKIAARKNMDQFDSNIWNKQIFQRTILNEIKCVEL